MSEYKDLFNDFINSLMIRDQEQFITVSLPIFFKGNCDSTAIYVRKLNENDVYNQGFYIDDCKTVADYWELFDVDTEKQAEKIKKICDSFGVEIVDDRVTMIVPGDNFPRFVHAIGNFLQVLSLLGNLEL